MKRRNMGLAMLMAAISSSVATAQFGLNYQFAVARYNTNGSLDNTFDGDGRVITDFSSSSYEIVEAVAIQKDGKIVTAGSVIGFWRAITPMAAWTRRLILTAKC